MCVTVGGPRTHHSRHAASPRASPQSRVSFAGVTSRHSGPSARASESGPTSTTDGTLGPFCMRTVGGDQIRLQILGPLRVWRGDVELETGPRQQARLLAILLARAGRPVSAGELIDMIWGDARSAQRAQHTAQVRRRAPAPVGARPAGPARTVRICSGGATDICARPGRTRWTWSLSGLCRRRHGWRWPISGMSRRLTATSRHWGCGAVRPVPAPMTGAAASVFSTVNAEFLDAGRGGGRAGRIARSDGPGTARAETGNDDGSAA